MRTGNHSFVRPPGSLPNRLYASIIVGLRLKASCAFPGGSAKQIHAYECDDQNDGGDPPDQPDAGRPGSRTELAIDKGFVIETIVRQVDRRFIRLIRPTRIVIRSASRTGACPGRNLFTADRADLWRLGLDSSSRHRRSAAFRRGDQDSRTIDFLRRQSWMACPQGSRTMTRWSPASVCISSTSWAPAWRRRSLSAVGSLETKAR